MDKKKAFQLIITAFHEKNLPTLYLRDIKVPHFDKAIAITGVRRSGKSFLVYHEIKMLLGKGVPLKIFYILKTDITYLLVRMNDLISFAIRERSLLS